MPIRYYGGQPREVSEAEARAYDEYQQGIIMRELGISGYSATTEQVKSFTQQALNDTGLRPNVTDSGLTYTKPEVTETKTVEMPAPNFNIETSSNILDVAPNSPLANAVRPQLMAMEASTQKMQVVKPSNTGNVPQPSSDWLKSLDAPIYYAKNPGVQTTRTDVEIKKPSPGMIEPLKPIQNSLIAGAGTKTSNKIPTSLTEMTFKSIGYTAPAGKAVTGIVGFAESIAYLPLAISDSLGIKKVVNPTTGETRDLIKDRVWKNPMETVNKDADVKLAYDATYWANLGYSLAKIGDYGESLRLTDELKNKAVVSRPQVLGIEQVKGENNFYKLTTKTDLYDQLPVPSTDLKDYFAINTMKVKVSPTETPNLYSYQGAGFSQAFSQGLYGSAKPLTEIFPIKSAGAIIQKIATDEKALYGIAGKESIDIGNIRQISNVAGAGISLKINEQSDYITSIIKSNKDVVASKGFILKESYVPPSNLAIKSIDNLGIGGGSKTLSLTITGTTVKTSSLASMVGSVTKGATGASLSIPTVGYGSSLGLATASTASKAISSYGSKVVTQSTILPKTDVKPYGYGIIKTGQSTKTKTTTSVSKPALETKTVSVTKIVSPSKIMNLSVTKTATQSSITNEIINPVPPPPPPPPPEPVYPTERITIPPIGGLSNLPKIEGSRFNISSNKKLKRRYGYNASVVAIVRGITAKKIDLNREYTGLEIRPMLARPKPKSNGLKLTRLRL